MLKPYGRESWGISRTEYDRLAEAVDQGILPDFTVNGWQYELRAGSITADELINVFDSSRRFHSQYSQFRDSIMEQKFFDLAAYILDNNADVHSYKFFRPAAIQITLYSRSRKSKWNTLLNFDDNGRITGKYTYTQGYKGASQPWSIGDAISRRIKSSLYDDER